MFKKTLKTITSGSLCSCSNGQSFGRGCQSPDFSVLPQKHLQIFWRGQASLGLNLAGCSEYLEVLRTWDMQVVIFTALRKGRKEVDLVSRSEKSRGQNQENRNGERSGCGLIQC